MAHEDRKNQKPEAQKLDAVQALQSPVVNDPPQPPAEIKSAAQIEAEAKAAYKQKLQQLKKERDLQLEEAKKVKGPGRVRGDKRSASYAIRRAFFSDMTQKPKDILEKLKPQFPEIKEVTISSLCSDARANYEVLNDLAKEKEQQHDQVVA